MLSVPPPQKATSFSVVLSDVPFQRGSPRKGVEQYGTGRFTPGNNNGGGGAPGNSSSRCERDRQRDEDCFGASSLANDADVMRKEFDFDGNLALFDKRQVFEEIEVLFVPA